MASKKQKLKEMLSKVGEKLSPSTKKERMGYEEKGERADTLRKGILERRAKRGKNTLTAMEKAKAFKGKPMNAFSREEQLKNIIKRRKLRKPTGAQDLMPKAMPKRTLKPMSKNLENNG